MHSCTHICTCTCTHTTCTYISKCGVCTYVYPKNESHCKKLIELINYDTRNSTCICTCTCTGFGNDVPNRLSTHVEKHVFSAKLNIHA